ncbi:MAG TPA: PAS domain S-box protein, partial [Flavisolibacter sp.]
MSKIISQFGQRNYNLLLDSVKDHAIMIVDTNGYITNWSGGAEKVNGYTEREIVGKHLSIFYTDEEVKKGEPQKHLEKTRDLGRLEYEGYRVR